jgi:hypothetical protein
MDDIFKNAPISVSVIDYLGKVEDGVGLLLSLVAEDTSYELGYWFNKNGHVRLVPEPKLLKKLGIEDIYKYEYIQEFIYFIHHSLPDTDEILNEFLNK